MKPESGSVRCIAAVDVQALTGSMPFRQIDRRPIVRSGPSSFGRTFRRAFGLQVRQLYLVVPFIVGVIAVRIVGAAGRPDRAHNLRLLAFDRQRRLGKIVGGAREGHREPEAILATIAHHFSRRLRQRRQAKNHQRRASDNGSRFHRIISIGLRNSVLSPVDPHNRARLRSPAASDP